MDMLRNTIRNVVCVMIVIMTASGCGSARIREYMKPYERLVQCKATESKVVAQEGKPNAVVRSDKELRSWLERFKPRTDGQVRVESKVLIYYADPWHDSEGYVVYVFINKQGVADRAVFGG